MSTPYCSQTCHWYIAVYIWTKQTQCLTCKILLILTDDKYQKTVHKCIIWAEEISDYLYIEYTMSLC